MRAKTNGIFQSKEQPLAWLIGSIFEPDGYSYERSEMAGEKADRVASALSALIEVLVDKGVLTEDDVNTICGTSHQRHIVLLDGVQGDDDWDLD